MGNLARIAAASAVIFLTTISARATARPACAGIDTRLTKNHARQLSGRVAEQFHEPGTTVRGSFKLQGWTVVIADFTDSDAGFVFYRGDPMHAPYVTVWTGAAGISEEEEQRQWATMNARGIPPKLAACFAWYTTKSGNW